MKKVRLGVIGTGTMGRFHLGKLGEVRNVELTAVCDIDTGCAREAAAPYGCAAYDDHRKLLKDKVCDAVLIVTPHYAHTTIGIDALRAGLHVLVEKPISVHKADCERLIAAHKNRNQIFAAMFNQRTDPRYRKLRQLVTARSARSTVSRGSSPTGSARTHTTHPANGARRGAAKAAASC